MSLSFLFLYLIFSRYFNNSFINQIINNLGDGDFKDLIVYFIDYQNNINYRIRGNPAAKQNYRQSKPPRMFHTPPRTYHSSNPRNLNY